MEEEVRAHAAVQGLVDLRREGFGFGPRGTLRTPWGSGVWGVLPDKPGLLFADFGGSRHELSFDAWPAFTSARCADGDVVRGELFA